MKTVKFGYLKETKQNPYVGFTSFQHFGNDTLYSDLVVLPENNMTETENIECYPIPDYVEENGKEQGYYPDCSVAYIRVLWKEFEPKQGEYRFDFIEDILHKAKDNGQTVMLRIMPHSTRESDDVPNWLKSIIDCPPRPAGKREKVSPGDPQFLELFGNAIKALGKRFDGNPTLAFLDVSLPGAWGEGACCDMFTNEQLQSFVSIYTSAFQNTHLIGQIESPELINYMRKTTSVGWRADCIGEPWCTNVKVPKKSETLTDVWQTGHVSFETYWWLGEWNRKGWSLDDIIGTTLSWHISTFNAKSFPIPYEWKEKIDMWVSKMGYHFVINEARFTEIARCGEKFSLNLEIENIGVAPIYTKIPLCIKLKSKYLERVFVTDIDITRWIEGKYCENISIDLPVDFICGNYLLQIGICGVGYPSVCFATAAKQDGDYSVLGNFLII